MAVPHLQEVIFANVVPEFDRKFSFLFDRAVCSGLLSAIG
jgi:hypothetical protein